MQFERFSKPCAAKEPAKLFRWARLPQPSGCVKQGLGKALPNMIPMGQNERNAKTGTSVESCSLLLQTSFHFTADIFSAKSRVRICKHFVNKLPSPAVRHFNSFCFYGIAAAIGLRHTNGNIGVTISNIRPECFSPYPYYNFKSAFWPVLQKTIEINRLTLSSPLLRPDLGESAKLDTKNGQDFRLAQSAQAISPSLFNLNTSQMSLIRS